MIVAPDGAATTFNDTEWKLTKTGVLAETTDSGSEGWQRRKLVVKGGSFTVSFVWDSDNLPDTDVTLDEGDEIELKLELGESGKFYQFDAIIETLEITDNNVSDVIRGTISGFANGPITDPVT